MAHLREILIIAHKHGLRLARTKLRTVVISRNYSERLYEKTVFRPSFSEKEPASYSEEVAVDKKTTLHDLHLEKEAKKMAVRKLNAIDKKILVWLGKYKNIDEVPNELVFDSLAKRKEAARNMKHEFLGTAFKYVYFFEYASLIITMSILAYALTLYSKYRKTVEKEEDT